MLIETLKLAFLFLLVFVAMRILGKTLLSQWTAYDLVTIFFLAYSALSAVEVQGFIHACICIFLIMSLYLVLSKLSMHRILNHFIIGQPSILIRNGEIIQKNLQKTRFSLIELLSTLRSSGYPDIKDLEYAILEPNGKISIIPRENMRPLKPKDMDIDVTFSGLPITVVNEGNINHRNLQLIERDEQWLKNKLADYGYDNLHHIYYAYIKDNGELTIYPDVSYI
ncbi:DUF421 domain-containing protein [Salipaludibacillus daqingensis]|uniref:DUF421 domain-containing protein n=1 Tax=Salipaludibacillus daqingensis TaxID=3041001 RepID=UPI0024767A10|nr:DUF421 domain-containing protein [Salipaludibacillus daqingensis]